MASKCFWVELILNKRKEQNPFKQTIPILGLFVVSANHQNFAYILTLPLWPLRLAVFSNEKVEKIWIRLEFAAANKWPPLLKEH